jgi:hypothetical protein
MGAVIISGRCMNGIIARLFLELLFVDLRILNGTQYSASEYVTLDTDQFLEFQKYGMS